MRRFASLVLAVLLLGSTRATADEAGQPDSHDLKRLSIEELMTLDVTLSTRRPEPIADTPAAVSVVSGDEIRRAGVTSLADAVGLVAHVHAARSNNGRWSISTRGFNTVSANKMLVMVDGRTVYSPLFAGVFWNAVDYTLEDIERIEVVRGPGATLWGANAVNGVINIVTRDSRNTQGTFVQAVTGNEDPAVLDVRHGGAAGSGVYRVYARYGVRAGQRFADGTSAMDRRQRGQAGVRLDRGDEGTGLMLKADLLYDHMRLPDRAAAEFTIGSLQARWTRTLSPQSSVQVQSYLNHEDRDMPQQLTHRLTTFDIDAQHAVARSRHGFVWGGGARVNRDSSVGTPAIAFDPASRAYSLVNVFAQDEVALAPGRVFVTAGIKLERNVFSGIEWQPGVRGRVVLPARQMVWGSLSRATRRPTRIESDLRIGAPAVTLRGNPDFRPERLVASEIGYRVRPAAAVSADITLFSHQFDMLRSVEAPTGPGPVIIGNTLNGSSIGIEATFNVQPVNWWRTHIAYTGQRVRVTRDAESRHVGVGGSEANDPAHQWSIRTALDLPRGVLLDARVRSIARLPEPRVPAYTELTARIAWQPNGRVELALAGDDLLHAQHAEFNPTARGFEEFERSIRVTLSLWSR